MERKYNKKVEIGARGTLTPYKEKVLVGEDNVLILPKNTKKILRMEFGRKDKLAVVIIPEGVEEIEDSAFYECSNLSFVLIPESVKKIGRKAFSGCESLKEVIFLGEGLEEIGESAFEYTHISRIEFPNSLKKLGKQIFKMALIDEIVVDDDLVIPMCENLKCGTQKTIVYPKNKQNVYYKVSKTIMKSVYDEVEKRERKYVFSNEKNAWTPRMPEKENTEHRLK